MKFTHCIGIVAAAAVSMTSALALEPGDTAPDFTLKDVNGKEVSLADFKGKLVVLEWINFDCPFVKKHYQSGNMPKLQETYAGKGVVWLSINSGAVGKQGYLPAPELGERAAKEGGKASAVLLDTSGDVGHSYDAKTTPHMFVITKDGKVAYAGGIDDKPDTDQASIEGATNFVSDALDALLAGKPVEVGKAKPYGCSVKY